ncbi:MAG: transposase, partial [Acidimicrobiales bacterium]
MNLTTASAFMAAVGDIGRFENPSQLVSYLGLNPKVHQSGMAPARHGSISKQGCAGARWALIESAWVVARNPGPLHAFGDRIRARRGVNVATVAVARKLVVLFWRMLTNDEECAFGRPSLTAEKHRRMELTAGASTARGKRSGGRVYASADQRLRKQQVAVHAERAYRQFVSERRTLARTTRLASVVDPPVLGEVRGPWPRGASRTAGDRVGHCPPSRGFISEGVRPVKGGSARRVGSIGCCRAWSNDVRARPSRPLAPLRIARVVKAGLRPPGGEALTARSVS